MMDFICSPSLYLLYADLLTCCLLQINSENTLQYFYDTTGCVHIIRKYGLLQISTCRRPRDSRIVFRLLTTAMANTYIHTYHIIPRIQKILSKKKDLFIVDILVDIL